MYVHTESFTDGKGFGIKISPGDSPNAIEEWFPPTAFLMMVRDEFEEFLRSGKTIATDVLAVLDGTKSYENLPYIVNWD